MRPQRTLRVVPPCPHLHPHLQPQPLLRRQCQRLPPLPSLRRSSPPLLIANRAKLPPHRRRRPSPSPQHPHQQRHPPQQPRPPRPFSTRMRRMKPNQAKRRRLGADPSARGGGSIEWPAGFGAHQLRQQHRDQADAAPTNSRQPAGTPRARITCTKDPAPRRRRTRKNHPPRQRTKNHRNRPIQPVRP